LLIWRKRVGSGSVSVALRKREAASTLGWTNEAAVADDDDATTAVAVALALALAPADTEVGPAAVEAGEAFFEPAPTVDEALAVAVAVAEGVEEEAAGADSSRVGKQRRSSLSAASLLIQPLQAR
jgi:hypothetical protein